MVLAANQEQRIGLIRVTNVGRRPAYLAVVALELPEGFQYKHLVLKESIGGERLDEGAAPVVITVNYDRLAHYAAAWSKIRAVAEDSSDKEYYSDYPKVRPSWANQA
jgi:hypothetical protein